MTDIVNWLGSSQGSAWASWTGLIVSVVGFTITYRAAQASKLASEKALAAVANINVLENLNESVSLLQHLKELHYVKAEPHVMELHYSSVAKLLIEAAESSKMLSELDRQVIHAIVLHLTLAQEECGRTIIDSTYVVDTGRLTTNLINDAKRLTKTHAAIRNKIGDDYAR